MFDMATLENGAGMQSVLRTVSRLSLLSLGGSSTFLLYLVILYSRLKHDSLTGKFETRFSNVTA